MKKPSPLRFIPLQLCTLGDSPSGNDWLHEIKFDGYRIEAIIDEDGVRLFSRNKKDWTHKFIDIAQDLRNFPVKNAILDGEVVVLDEQGISRFQMLQNMLLENGRGRLLYYVIDILCLDDTYTLDLPLIERKKLLKNLFKKWRKKSSSIIPVDFIQGDGQFLFEQACSYGLEGIVSKRINSPYRSKRTSDWIKAKCLFEEDFVIGGYTTPRGGRVGFGSLALGYFQKNELVYCGNVGTGFSDQTLKKVLGLLQKRSQQQCPFVNGKGLKMHWVKPDLVTKVRFSEWTDDGLLRQPVFLGLRMDGTSKANETQKLTGGKTSSAKKKLVANVSLSNPDKQFFDSPKVTKEDLAHFYEAIHEWILPHIINRPLSLFRCPNGINEKGFFQKHFMGHLPKGIYAIKTPHEQEPYIMIKELQGLIGLVQIAALEIHPWNSQKKSLTKPDRIIFDLDPADDVDFAELRHCARRLREVLLSYSLKSFLKTTGGKGLHLVVPITPSGSHREVTDFAKKMAGILVEEHPEKYLLTMSKAKRVGKIFIDYLRNPEGATAIAPYSLRARTGATVAVPLGWEELARLKNAQHYSLLNLLKRLRQLQEDPWGDFFTTNQTMPKI